MKFTFIIVVVCSFVSATSFAQQAPEFSLSLHGGLFPEFTIHDDDFTESTVLDFRAHMFDKHNTRLEYTLNFSLGYDPSVFYSYGISAGVPIQLGDRGVLKPGFGLENYKLKNRECSSTVRTILNALFNVDDPCSDDVHASFNPSLALEMNIAGRVWIVFDATYRAMLSSTHEVRETITETYPDGTEREFDISETRHSFYGAGLGFGTGIRINF